MAFGKSGRPPEDRLARQREIYEAVAPLIVERGVRRLAMTDAADAACLSVGGLYHYFPSKRDLVLHALRPEAIERTCHDFQARYGHLAETDPPAYAETYFTYAVAQVAFFRPAVHAALELGGTTFWDTVTASLTAGLDAFSAALRAIAPAVDEAHVALLAQVLRQILLAAILDRHQTPETLEAQLRAVVARHTEHVRAAAPITVP